MAYVLLVMSLEINFQGVVCLVWSWLLFIVPKITGSSQEKEEFFLR